MKYKHDKVEKMVAANGGQFYSNYTYQEVVKMLDQREPELREFYENKLQEKIKAEESKYERKMTETKQEQQQITERLQSELKAVRRFSFDTQC